MSTESGLVTSSLFSPIEKSFLNVILQSGLTDSMVQKHKPCPKITHSGWCLFDHN
eukprot:m.73134 g.73134  ORF g.73134 m.73134 type:complete len:55 (+) comp10194_c0_seq1:2525-2689(+)